MPHFVNKRLKTQIIIPRQNVQKRHSNQVDNFIICRVRSFLNKCEWSIQDFLTVFKLLWIHA